MTDSVDEAVSLVRRAQGQAAQDLATLGYVRTTVFLLTQVVTEESDEKPQPQLLEPQLLASTVEERFASHDDFADFLASVRNEVRRLGASVVLISGEATAELDDGGSTRVALIRIEDGDGIHLLHADIFVAHDGMAQLGTFSISRGAEDGLGGPILPCFEET